MGDNEFTVLGSSSGMPQTGRACSGYALRVGDSVNLIDCGGGVTSAFLRCGFDPRTVRRVFISHTHPDHCCDLPLFIQMIFLTGRKLDLDVYLPSEFVDPFETALHGMYLYAGLFQFPLRLHGYEDGFEFTEDFHLTAIGNKHLRPYKEFIAAGGYSNRLQCHSFRIEVDGCRPLLYSADIDSLEDIRPHVSGCGLVVMELTHVDFEQFAEMASGESGTRFVITHLGYPDAVEELKGRITRSGLVNVVLAEDGMMVEV